MSNSGEKEGGGLGEFIITLQKLVVNEVIDSAVVDGALDMLQSLDFVSSDEAKSDASDSHLSSDDSTVKSVAEVRLKLHKLLQRLIGSKLQQELFSTLVELRAAAEEAAGAPERSEDAALERSKEEPAAAAERSKEEAAAAAERSKEEAAAAAERSTDESEDVSHFTTFYEPDIRVGKGGYGKVFKCKQLLDEGSYAVKKAGYVKGDLKKLLNEVKVHRLMKHPNIISYVHSWTEKGYEVDSSSEEKGDDSGEKSTHTLYIALELASHSLYDVMEDKQKVHQYPDRATAFKYMEQIFTALDYIHSKGYVHGDISRKNVLIDDDNNVKLCDFGKARELDPTIRLNEEDFGDPIYEAPEAEHNILIPASDIYSGGLVVYEILSKFSTGHLKKVAFDEIKIGKHIFKDEDEIFTKILATDAQERPTAREVVNLLLELKLEELGDGEEERGEEADEGEGEDEDIGYEGVEGIDLGDGDDKDLD